MSEQRPMRNVLTVLLVCLLVASAFSSPFVFTGVVEAESVTGNDSVDVVWGTWQTNPARTGYASGVAPPANNPSVAWQTGQSDPIRTSPAVANDAVYVGSANGWVSALDSDDGSEQWAFEANASLQSPTLGHGAIYVGDANGGLYAIDATNGSLLWHRSLGTQIVGAPVVVDHTMYVTAANDGTTSVWRLDADNGQEWWKYSVSGNDGSAPAVGSGRVLFSVGGEVHAFDRISGNYEWSTLLDQSGGLTAPTAVGNDRVVVADRNPSAENGTVYALGTQAGNVEWSHDTTTEPVGSPAVAHGTVYVAASDSQSNAILRVDATTGTGSATPTTYDVRSSPVVAENTVFVGTANGILAANASSSSTRYFHEVADDGTPSVASAPAIGNRSLYVGLDRTNDSVYKLSGDDLDHPPTPAIDAPTSPEAGTTVTLSGTDSYDFDGPITSYEWDVDGDGTFEKTGESIDYAFDTVGEQRVTLRVTDDTGVTNETTETLTVRDETPPTAPDVSAPDGWVRDTATVSWGNVTDNESGFDHYEIRKEGWKWQTASIESETITEYYTRSYNFSVRGVDEAGNRGPVVTETLRFDLSEPLVGVGLRTSSSRDTATLTVNVTDRESGVTPQNVSIVVDGNPVSGNRSVVGDSVVYVENFSKGSHQINVTATDNRSNTVRRNMTLDTNFAGGGGSSGGGGGGGGGGDIPPPPAMAEIVEADDGSLRVEVTGARAGDSASVPLSALETDGATFQKLRITPRSEEAEPRFFIDASVASAPGGAPLPSDESLGFLRVEPTYVKNSDLAGATVRFRVPTDGVSPDEVTAYRYRDGSWRALETEFVGKRDGEYAFRAKANGVSLFGVGVTHSAEQTTSSGTNGTAADGDGGDGTDSDATTEAAMDDATETAVRETSGDGSGSVPGFGPVVAAAAFAVALAVARHRE